MAFSIEASPLHRPLGFELDLPRLVHVERHAPERPGAAAAALLPDEELDDAANRWSRAQLRRSADVARALVGVTGTADATAVEAAAAAAAAACTTGGDAAPVVVAALPARQPVVASARGIVDGHRVSLLGFALGKPTPGDRTALRFTLLTDARLAPATLAQLLREIDARCFSTLAGAAEPRPGDGRLALASGVAGDQEIADGSIGLRTLLVGAVAVAQALVRRLLEESFAPERRARVVQISVAGAGDEAQAAAVAERLAADPALRAALSAARPDPEPALALLRAAGLGRAGAHVRLAPGAEQAALGVELHAGRCEATRWTAVPRDPRQVSDP